MVQSLRTGQLLDSDDVIVVIHWSEGTRAVRSVTPSLEVIMTINFFRIDQCPYTLERLNLNCMILFMFVGIMSVGGRQLAPLRTHSNVIWEHSMLVYYCH